MILLPTCRFRDLLARSAACPRGLTPAADPLLPGNEAASATLALFPESVI